jgi:geranylgeranyl diphosphate synthase type II
MTSKQFAKAFEASLPLPFGTEPHLEGALRHLLEHPGSLVRPRIVFEVARAFDVKDHASLELALALEYFHTASLVFDDLPCMDDAQQRRGAACVHVKYGEAGGILAALALINRAYALVWRAVSACSPNRQSQALAYLEQRLGPEGLLGGQSLDLHYSALPHDGATTGCVALGKTVSLIRLTLVLPAMLGGAGVGELRCLERIALFWGLGYQIVDDFKDVLEGTSTTGKSAARDQALDRPNIVLAIGVAKAIGRLSRLLQLGEKALTRLQALRPSLSFLQKLHADLQSEAALITESAHAVGGQARS